MITQVKKSLITTVVNIKESIVDDNTCQKLFDNNSARHQRKQKLKLSGEFVPRETRICSSYPFTPLIKSRAKQQF